MYVLFETERIIYVRIFNHETKFGKANLIEFNKLLMLLSTVKIDIWNLSRFRTLYNSFVTFFLSPIPTFPMSAFCAIKPKAWEGKENF
jgi:hypothetical protein